MLCNKLNGIGLRKFTTKSEEVLSFRSRLFRDSWGTGGGDHVFEFCWQLAEHTHLPCPVVGSLRSAVFGIYSCLSKTMHHTEKYK